MAVAKAAKKPAVVKAKATGKATGKAVVKKPTAAKAVVKKPAVAKVAKFNLNKLMMLIVRDAPKKGKKMMGGYKKAALQARIFTPITDFITKHKERIKNRITELLSNEVLLKTTIQLNAGDATPIIFNDTFNESNIEQFIINIGEHAYLRNTLDNFTLPNIPDKSTELSKFDKRTYDCNFMTIVIALCKVYKLFNENTE